MPQIKVAGNRSFKVNDGEIRRKMTEKDRAAFGLEGSKLNEALGKYWKENRNPERAWVTHATDYEYDPYTRWDWKPVYIALNVLNVEVTEVDYKPVVVAQQDFPNNTSTDMTATAQFTHELTTEAESNWTNSNTLSFEQTFGYEFGLPKIGTVKGETKFGYSRSWGEGGSKRTSEKLAIQSQAQFVVAPGKKKTAVLEASKGTMKVKITYQACVGGQIAHRFNRLMHRHHEWGIWINTVLDHAGIPNVINITEDIEIGFYSQVKITVSDENGQQQSMPVQSSPEFSSSPVYPGGDGSSQGYSSGDGAGGTGEAYTSGYSFNTADEASESEQQQPEPEPEPEPTPPREPLSQEEIEGTPVFADAPDDVEEGEDEVVSDQ